MLGAGYQFYFSPRECGDANTEYEKRMIYIAVGYFTYDLLCMTWYGLLDWAMLLHHNFTAFGMLLSLCSETSACLIVLGMFVAEVSNPPMHVRVMLKHLGLRYTKAYETCEISFIMLYCYSRIFCGSWMTWRACNCQHLYIFQKITAVFLLVQTMHFVRQMVGILIKRFNEISNRKKKGIKMRWFEPLNKEELEVLGIKAQKEKHIL